MTSGGGIINLYAFKYGLTQGFAIHERLILNRFHFQLVEETHCASVDATNSCLCDSCSAAARVMLPVHDKHASNTDYRGRDGLSRLSAFRAGTRPLSGRHKPTQPSSSAYNDTRVKVYDDCQIEPTLAGHQVSDITYLFLVWCRCRKVLRQQIWGYWQPMLAVSGHLKFTRCLKHQFLASYAVGNGINVSLFTVFSKLSLYTTGPSRCLLASKAATSRRTKSKPVGAQRISRRLPPFLG